MPSVGKIPASLPLGPLPERIDVCRTVPPRTPCPDGRHAGPELRQPTEAMVSGAGLNGNAHFGRSWSRAARSRLSMEVCLLLCSCLFSFLYVKVNVYLKIDMDINIFVYECFGVCVCAF